jgi:ribonuclease HI
MFLFDSESGLVVWAAFEYLGDTTNNVAEYTALLSGIQFASAMGITKLVAEGDSTLVVKQVTGEYRVKSDHLIKLNKSVKAIADSFDSFSIHYIPRAENFRADQLANVAMDEQATMGLEVFDYLTEEDSQGSQESIHSDSVRSLPQDVEETAPLQQVASDKCIFIPEALASDRILSKNRTYVLKFGGGMKGNKGMGSAAILMDDLSDEELWSGAYFYPNEDASQFIASYVGLIIGLRKAMSMGVTRLIVQGNMEFVIQQMSGKWKVKSEAIKPYQAQAKEICENYFDDVDFEIISDNDNTSVKTLCFEAIQSRQSRLPGFSE